MKNKKVFIAIVLGLLFLTSLTKAQGWVTVGKAGFSSDTAGSTQIAIDISGTPYVAYNDIGNISKSVVMKFNGSSWEMVGITGFSDNCISIAIDGKGIPYVIAGAIDSAKVWKYNGSNWVIVGNTIFYRGENDCPNIAIDRNDTIYVAYEDNKNNGKATVMKYNGSGWVTVGKAGFSAGSIASSSMAINGSGTPYVVYEDYADTQKTTVMKYDDSSWVTVGSNGFAGAVLSPTIAIDSSGTPYVAYVNNKATVMKFDSGSWVTVGSGGFSAGVAEGTSIAIDGSGTPYVVYGDIANNGKATVMKYTGNNWVTLGNAGFSAGRANWTSIAIDANGTPYVVYRDWGNQAKATVMKYISGNGINEVGNMKSEVGIKVYSNPVNQLTVISYQLIEKCVVNLSIYDITGREIMTLENEVKDKGNYKVNLNAKILSEGLYIVKLSKDNTISVAKFIKG